MFMALYFFIHPKSKHFMKWSLVLIQIVITISIIYILPLEGEIQAIFPKHMKYDEARLVEKHILEDFHGGKVGYYLNRPFDEPYSAYEISYSQADWGTTLLQTEYVVIPTKVGIPSVLFNQPSCKYIFDFQTENNIIYKLSCKE